MRARLFVSSVPAVLALVACGSSKDGATTSQGATSAPSAPAVVAAQTSTPAPTAAPIPQVAATVADRTVLVTGVGEVSAPPDQVRIHLGVHASTAGVASALDQASADMTKVLAALRRLGVQASDIQTTEMSVGRDYNGATYWAEEGVDALVRHVANAGTVIVAATNAAGNDATAWGLTYSLSDPSAALARARQKAMDAAGAQAQAWARMSGYTLGAVLHVSDQPVSATASGGCSTGCGGGGVPISPGMNQVSVTVEVTYAMS